MIMKEVKSPYELVGYKMFMIGIEIFEHECKQNKKKTNFVMKHLIFCLEVISKNLWKPICLILVKLFIFLY